MEELVKLFVEDVRVGGKESGREALKQWFIRTMSVPKVSIHFVANHTIVMDDADNAHGVVYCYDQLERPDLGEWQYGFLQYWDKYVRRNGEWQFFRRKFHRWYICDALTRPFNGAGNVDQNNTLTTHQLPDAFPSWGRFWKEQAVKS